MFRILLASEMFVEAFAPWLFMRDGLNKAQAAGKPGPGPMVGILGEGTPDLPCAAAGFGHQLSGELVLALGCHGLPANCQNWRAFQV